MSAPEARRRSIVAALLLAARDTIEPSGAPRIVAERRCARRPSTTGLTAAASTAPDIVGSSWAFGSDGARDVSAPQRPSASVRCERVREWRCGGTPLRVPHLPPLRQPSHNGSSTTTAPEARVRTGPATPTRSLSPGAAARSAKDQFLGTRSRHRERSGGPESERARNGFPPARSCRPPCTSRRRTGSGASRRRSTWPSVHSPLSRIAAAPSRPIPPFSPSGHSTSSTGSIAGEPIR